ncbi:type VII secretion protein EccCa [Allokutzneria sp. A3M-2-11 16]|uniref:type VII secretion protein EccCa n=1 Tax=Allokutzneria sp. A3M-2-11 16 TaxID=2962043 RepID=UPI0020B8B3F7|nr:type VII secretion protein EccCa [Allokutzneria sp. A3M-2-11 16]MCP3798851.1 type VII secretion protein EccCa [Allokutzneria sp. A3M-2-11 16]
MSTLQFKRSARLSPPRMPGGELLLEAPPEVPRVIPANILMKMLPPVMIGASVLMMALVFITGGQNPSSLIFGGMFLLSTIGMMAGGGFGGTGKKKAEMNEDRKDYLRYLGQMRERARQAGSDQREAREWVHPDPQALWSLAATRRMWERRSGDPDFCHLRMGRGAQRLETRLRPPETGPVDELEPITTLALRKFIRAHSIVPDLPSVFTLRAFAAVALHGERERTRALARALLAQLVTFHAPDDVLVAVVATAKARAEWEWTKWLPHVQHPRLTDGIGSLRMITGSLKQVETWLAEEMRDRPRFTKGGQQQPELPHIVIVVDEGEVAGDEHVLLTEGLSGVTLLDLSDSIGTLSKRRGIRLTIQDGRIGALSGTGGVEWFGGPDAMTVTEAEALARRISPYRILTGAGAELVDEPLLTSDTGLFELLGLGDPMSFEIAHAWRPRPISDRFKVAFGVGEHGQPVELDIKEAAVGGMGPHGLCIGATGSGKSEFLRTLVLGMIATHSSAMLNLILVDFKGGATFAGLEGAPHVAAVITNLADDLTLVDRMQDAIAGEMNRRQEALRDGGNFKNVWEYERARENGADLDPLPALFIVVDEFSELLSAKPDFIELFVAIGRLGRSLQIHLLLASQQLEEGRLRGLDGHLSYRIGLKTFSASESRSVLGVPDAYELPPVPGSGYLKFDTNTLVRFKACYVSGPHRPPGMQAVRATAPVTGDRRPRLFVPDFVEIPVEPEVPASADEPAKPERPTEPSELDIVVHRVQRKGPEAHAVWLPPLNEPPSLDLLLPNLSPTEDRGLSPVDYFGAGKLITPVGIVDRPYEQRRDTLWADFSGGGGHAAVVGAPRAGKSMLLRSIVMSMALTHTAEEAQFYCLDFGGGTLVSLQNLPHVGGYGGRFSPDLVRRMVAELKTLLAEREERFRELGIESMVEFRARKRRGEIVDDPFGDVFLVVDGWAAFRQEFELLEEDVVKLAAQGLSYGVHVVVAATRWAEIRPSLKDLLGTRFELRLGDPSESDVDRRVALNVPADRPGRGASKDRLHFLTALPRIDGAAKASSGVPMTAEDVGTGISDAVAKISAAWRGRSAPPVRMLPDSFPYARLPGASPELPRHAIPIGIDEDELKPVYLDFESESHFVCFAEQESGKTNLLRTIVQGVVDRFTPKQARIILVDYRRTMLGFVTSEHLLAYAAGSQQFTGMVEDIHASLTKRLPGPDVTQEQLKNRSWWSGPELFLVVDDYDLVATSGNNPLAPLGDFLAQARDIGLHLVVARASGGASRALYDPVLGKLREQSAPGIVMSGNRDEGALVGTVKPSSMPPGRGTLVNRRSGQRVVQLAWLDPA